MILPGVVDSFFIDGSLNKTPELEMTHSALPTPP